MSASNGNGWKPRKIESLKCPSGVSVQIRRPGPEFTMRAGAVARTFTKNAGKDAEPPSMTPEQLEDYYLRQLNAMSDEELAARMILFRELVCAMLVSPKLVREPNPDKDEIGPDDIGNDFWFLVDYALKSFYGIGVPVGDSEVTIAEVESFRSQSGISGHGTDSGSVPPTTEQPA